MVLASASPRRIELLKDLVSSFAVIPGRIEETPRRGEAPSTYAVRVAREKAEAAARIAGLEGRDCWILGADTIVVLDGEIFGKPGDPDRARRMLERLQGREHEVMTGVCLTNPARALLLVGEVRSRVRMRPLGGEQIEAYVRTGEPLDKAGGYAVQGIAGRFIERVEGSYTNVVGLPVERVREWFAAHGILGRTPAGRESGE